MAVFLGKGFEQDKTDWSHLRAKNGGGGGGSAAGSAMTGRLGAATPSGLVANAKNFLLPFSTYFHGAAAPLAAGIKAEVSIGSSQWPISTAPASVAAAPAAAAPIAAPTSKQGNGVTTGANTSDLLHVLIVEDSLPIMKALTMNLRRSKHTVEQAVNGLIGLECMKQKEFDVVVMDLQVCVSVDGDGGG